MVEVDERIDFLAVAQSSDEIIMPWTVLALHILDYFCGYLQCVGPGC